MGCFSYLCKECGKGILSNSFRGEKVKLFYLKDGEVVEQMEGEYNSYGSVFIDGTQRKDNRELRQSVVWKHEQDIDEAHMENHYASTVLLTYERYKTDPILAEIYRNSIQTEPKPIRCDWGIAAIHSRCFKKYPTTISEDDPDQGWGESGELFGDIDVNLTL